MTEAIDLSRAAKAIRRRVLTMVYKAKASHVGSALSIVDILAVLYFDVLAVDPRNPRRPERDRFILSKGHACAALYATLVERGFFPEADLESFVRDGGLLAGHPILDPDRGIEASSGSLGHGLPLGVGLALAAKRDRRSSRVVILMSDGECDEGSVWEAALLAAQLRLDNLTIVVDYNKLQNFGRVKDIIDLEPLAAKWAAFGWGTAEIDGHDHGAIRDALRSASRTTERPTAIIAHTIKGKGVSFMEDRLEWHYRSPGRELYEQALREIEAS